MPAEVGPVTNSVSPLKELDYHAPRRCMREPIAEIFMAADMLDRAVGAHHAGEREEAERLIRSADQSTVRLWTESLWGSLAANPEIEHYRRFREVNGAAPALAKDKCVPVRMPNRQEKAAILQRWGHRCAFCSIPVIRPEVRQAFSIAYPEAAYWGTSNATQHAAFQCMWLQFDHILPHSRGGDNSVENIAITCAPCNYGRMQWTLDELGLLDPRTQPLTRSSWDGLERFLSGTTATLS